MATKDEIISTLNDLIETCKDGEKGFREAAEAVKRDDLRRLFQSFSQQRRQFVTELQAEVRRFGGDPEKSGSVSGALHRGWINFKSAITGKDDDAIISECERGEDVARKTFEDALKKDLPSELQTIISRLFSQVKDVHDRVRALEVATSKR